MPQPSLMALLHCRGQDISSVGFPTAQGTQIWLGRGRERTMPIGPGPWTITIQLERQAASPSELPQGRRHLLFLSCPSCQQELVHPTLPQAKTPPAHAGAQLPAEEQARKLDYKPVWLAQKAFWCFVARAAQKFRPSDTVISLLGIYPE